jgi:hypothetical protein
MLLPKSSTYAAWLSFAAGARIHRLAGSYTELSTNEIGNPTARSRFLVFAPSELGAAVSPTIVSHRPPSDPKRISSASAQ